MEDYYDIDSILSEDQVTDAATFVLAIEDRSNSLLMPVPYAFNCTEHQVRLSKEHTWVVMAGRRTR